MTKLLAEEATEHNGLVQTTATLNGETVAAELRYARATANLKIRLLV